MKYIFILLCTFLLPAGFLKSQPTVSAVTNVVTQVSEERDKVTITYDLARKTGIPAYNVAVKITLDGEVVSAQALSGDVGPNVTPGYGKRITWDVLKDLSELYGSLQIEVTAKSNAPDCVPIKTIPVYAGLGGAAAAGFALIITGLTLDNDHKPLYEIYRNNTDPTASVYSELSRSDHYKEANSKHKKGQLLAAGGAAVLVGGGIIMVTRLIQINKYNKKCAGKTSDTSPKLNWQPIVNVGRSKSVSAGIAVNF